MYFRALLLPVLLLFLAYPAAAQPYYTISGIVQDSISGETLIGVSIKLTGSRAYGSSTNAYGYYSGKYSPGEYQLTASYVGYRSKSIRVSLITNLRIDLSLVPDNAIDEVVISSELPDQNVSGPLMGLAKLSMNEVRNVPVLFGERDVLKTLQLIPGIKSAGEGNSGIYVRGGAADQNLILLDEAPVYNASHLLGFFSTFNSDAIKDLSVFKGGMPAQYGGRLSSVLDIRMREGNKKRFTAEGGIGLISSRVKVEGPIFKEKSSFMISARRTYADVFLGFAKDTLLSENTLYFYDLNAKANFQINPRNTIFVSGYFGRDELGLNETFGFGWGNATGTFRWNHIFNPRLFSNSSLIFSNYNYEIENLLQESNFIVSSSIRDMNFKQDLQMALSSNHNIRFGGEFIHHTIAPGKITTNGESSVNELQLENRNGLETALYISDEWQVNNRISLVYGLRASTFSLLGEGTFRTYSQTGSILSEEYYPEGKVVKSYIQIEPRFSMSIKMSNTSALKTSFTRNTQNLHLMSNSTASSPTDLYIMSSRNVKPEFANQFGFGYFTNIRDDRYEISIESYYKRLMNQIEYRSGTDLRGNSNVEAELVYGLGRAYGVELFAKKRHGKLNGWIGYTLSKSERKFESINDSRWFNARQDRTHDVSVVAIWQATTRWTVSSTFVYSTGNAVTFPVGKYQAGSETVYLYPERNSNRMPDYHRLDLAATLEARKGNKMGSSWSFSLYNAYNRKNAYFIDFRDDPDQPSKTQAVQTSLFGIIPSVTWNFKF